MADHFKLIALLQKIDTKISAIDEKLASFQNEEEMYKKLASAKKTYENKQAAYIKLDADVKDMELESKTLAAKSESLRKKMYGGSITHTKELSALEKEIASLTQKASVIDEKLITSLEELAASKEKLASNKKTISDYETKLNASSEKNKSIKIELSVIRTELLKKRNDCSLKIPDKSVLYRYDSIRKKHGTAIAVVAANSKCSICKVTVTPYILTSLRDSMDMQICENCGRILILNGE